MLKLCSRTLRPLLAPWRKQGWILGLAVTSCLQPITKRAWLYLWARSSRWTRMLRWSGAQPPSEGQGLSSMHSPRCGVWTSWTSYTVEEELAYILHPLSVAQAFLAAVECDEDERNAIAQRRRGMGTDSEAHQMSRELTKNDSACIDMHTCAAEYTPESCALKAIMDLQTFAMQRQES